MKLSNTIIINETFLPNNKKAFTLAETLITLTILGIVAVIVVPSLINRQVENANRTKVKKAMAAYEKAINMMVMENELKTTQALKAYGEEETCKYTRAYFKTVQNGVNNCIFKTADKVWWDITDITNPIISLKDEITNSNKEAIRTNAMNYDADKVSFALIGRYDNVGTLRVDDNGFEQAQENNDNNKSYMTKLWSFINNQKVELDGFAKCNAEGATTCTVNVNGTQITYNKFTVNSDFSITNRCAYNRETDSQDCSYISKVTAGDYWITDNLGNMSLEEAQSACSSSSWYNKSECLTRGDYYEAAKLKCESLDSHLGTLAELSVAASQNKLTGDSHFWTLEEDTHFTGFGVSKTGHINSYYGKFNSDYQVVCIKNQH